MPRGDARARLNPTLLSDTDSHPSSDPNEALAEAKSQHPRLPWQERTAKAICAKT